MLSGDWTVGYMYVCCGLDQLDTAANIVLGVKGKILMSNHDFCKGALGES